MEEIRVELDFRDEEGNIESKEFDSEEKAWMFIEKNNINIYKMWRYIYCENCGEQVYLQDGFSNMCTCGADYNGFGQRLAPRSQWGWETGETF